MKTAAMCPKQGKESCQKQTEAQRERQGCILFSRGGMGTPGCVNKRAGGKIVVSSVASMHMVSKKDLNSAELETSRSPTTVMTANGEVQTREEATENVKQLDLFVKVMLLEETPAVLSLGNSVSIMDFHTTGPEVKNHISSEMARDLIAIYPTMYQLWFLV